MSKCTYVLFAEQPSSFVGVVDPTGTFVPFRWVERNGAPAIRIEMPDVRKLRQELATAKRRVKKLERKCDALQERYDDVKEFVDDF